MPVFCSVNKRPTALTKIHLGMLRAGAPRAAGAEWRAMARSPARSLRILIAGSAIN
jgi:hypothetical protein